jgi:hypothetical protein
MPEVAAIPRGLEGEGQVGIATRLAPGKLATDVVERLHSGGVKLWRDFANGGNRSGQSVG